MFVFLLSFSLSNNRPIPVLVGNVCKAYIVKVYKTIALVSKHTFQKQHKL